MTTAEKLTTIANNEQKVYDAGISAGIKNEDIKMWEMITNNGNRDLYNGLFRESDFTGYTFPNTICPSGSTIDHMFYDYAGTELPKNIDFTNLSETATASSTFAYARYITEIPDMNIPALNTYTATYKRCYSLETIGILRTHENTTFSGTFEDCKNLKNIVIDGKIGTNLNLRWCVHLTHDSLMSIINALYNYKAEDSTTRPNIILPPNLIEGDSAVITENEKQIIMNKGWNLNGIL